MTRLTDVYAALHAIMAPYAARLDAKRDDGVELYVDTRHMQKNGKPLFFGAVRLGKAHVSYHLMPVYLEPALLEDASPRLKARMQGKSCFNFTVSEPALLEELAALTARGFASYRKQGYA